MSINSLQGSLAVTRLSLIDLCWLKTPSLGPVTLISLSNVHAKHTFPFLLRANPPLFSKFLRGHEATFVVRWTSVVATTLCTHAKDSITVVDHLVFAVDWNPLRPHATRLWANTLYPLYITAVMGRDPRSPCMHPGFIGSSPLYSPSLP